jgi:hypothetical protein
MTDFKPDDLVVCINDGNCAMIRSGIQYIVAESRIDDRGGYEVRLLGRMTFYDAARFELVRLRPKHPFMVGSLR